MSPYPEISIWTAPDGPTIDPRAAEPLNLVHRTIVRVLTPSLKLALTWWGLAARDSCFVVTNLGRPPRSLGEDVQRARGESENAITELRDRIAPITQRHRLVPLT